MYAFMANDGGPKTNCNIHDTECIHKKQIIDKQKLCLERLKLFSPLSVIIAITVLLYMKYRKKISISPGNTVAMREGQETLT